MKEEKYKEELKEIGKRFMEAGYNKRVEILRETINMPSHETLEFLVNLLETNINKQGLNLYQEILFAIAMILQKYEGGKEISDYVLSKKLPEDLKSALVNAVETTDKSKRLVVCQRLFKEFQTRYAT
jgi:hypothetical protein